MPFPLLGIVAQGVLRWGGTAYSGKALAPAFKVTLAGGGAGVRKAVRKITHDTETAALRATNRAGRWGRTRIRRELSGLLNISQKNLRARERRASVRKRPIYVYTVIRREYRVHELRGTRFRPHVGQSRAEARIEAVGTLRIRAYGKTHDVQTGAPSPDRSRRPVPQVTQRQRSSGPRNGHVGEGGLSGAEGDQEADPG